jgi:ubiquinone biosynthesis protein UbiJ
MSTIKILVKIDNYVEVTPEMLSLMVNADQYSQEYSHSHQTITYVKNKSNVEIQTITDEEIITPQTVNIQDIMGENNRLSREIDILKEKLAKLTQSSQNASQTMMHQ